MKRSIFVAILGLFLVGGVARGTAPAGFAVLPGIYCTYQFITYEAGGYRSQGTCELTALTSLDYPNKHAPWGAVGTYDPSTREATESFDVGVSEADNNFYFGGIASWMSCSKDPWLNDVRDCRVEKVSTFGNIPQDVAESAMRKHGRPLTADLTSGQRATLQREYHARHFNGATPAQAAQVERAIPQNQTPQYHGTATPGQAAQVEGEIPRLADVDTSSQPLIPIPTTPFSGHAQKQSDNRRTAVTAQPIEIVEPAPGSQQSRGNVRIRVRGGSVASNANDAMIVELSALPPRPAQPGNPPHAPAQGSKTAQVSLAQLQQGVVLPIDVTSAWTGPTQVRVRAAQSGNWSNGVSFDLVAGNTGVTARPALPAWSALQSAPASPAARPVVVAPSSTQSATPSLVPHSSLGGGH